jgi:hypothetical protein
MNDIQTKAMTAIVVLQSNYLCLKSPQKREKYAGEEGGYEMVSRKFCDDTLVPKYKPVGGDWSLGKGAMAHR